MGRAAHYTAPDESHTLPARYRADRRRRATGLHAWRPAGLPRGRRDRPGHRRTAARTPLPPRDRHAGLAPARARFVRPQPSGPGPVRADHPAWAAADAVAAALRGR